METQRNIDAASAWIVLVLLVLLALLLALVLLALGALWDCNGETESESNVEDSECIESGVRQIAGVHGDVHNSCSCGK